MKKICIIGHARHGKDTIAEIMSELFGFKHLSSSQAASDIFLYNALKDKYGYRSPEECFEDRVNHRKEWFDMICEYNQSNPGRLASEIMRVANVYTGMRSKREIDSCLANGIFDLVIGVFNPLAKLEDSTSFDIDIWRDSHIVIPNAGSLDDLRQKILALKDLLI